MRISLKFWIVTCALCLTFAGRLNAASSNPYEDNFPGCVYDYYQLLPSDYFFDENPTKSDRLNMLVDEKENIVDNQNDYLYVRGGDGQWSIEMALFRYNGVVTVAISSGSYDPDIPSLEFKRYQSGKWFDVTKRVLSPSLIKVITNDADAYDNGGRTGRLATFTLPEHGTTINVYTRRGTVLRLHWVRGRFTASHYVWSIHKGE